MLFLRFFILSSLLILAPSHIYASDPPANEAAPVQALQQPSHEQANAGADLASGEVVAPRSQKDAPPESEKGKGVAYYPSDPVATKAVDRNIYLFAEKIRERFSLWLQRSGKYLEIMKGILRGKNIPEDIAFLPLIESGFNPSAYSVARAVGPWQFIASTARKYGLKIDWWRDERKDPIKSTEAAADYLNDLYGMFGSWNLAMAAYNAGEGKILSALNRSKRDDYWALLETRYIKRETKEYVPRFIAATLIATNPGEYGFMGLDYHSAMQFDIALLEKPIDLEVAALCADTSLDVIKELNPELRRWSTPPHVSPYPLRIPYGKKEAFFDNLLKIPDGERFSVSVYTVKKGDTLNKISKRVGVPPDVIAELNGDLPMMRQMKAGEKIYMPSRDKLSSDIDDRIEKKQASLKNKKFKHRNRKTGKQASGKVMVTSISKKAPYIND